jgi:hypothetical protein
MIRRCLPLAVLLSGVSAARCGDTPTAPERYANPLIVVRCTTASASSLNCTAPVHCSQDPCRPGTPTDVTASATWTTDDPLVARLTGPGTLAAVGTGYTTVRAVTPGVSAGFAAVAVFAGTPPLPVFGLQGTIRQGTPPNDVKIDEATIEALDGLVAGRIAHSGAPPVDVPGFAFPGPSAPGLYIINGVPPGTTRLRVTKEGFLPVERDVTFTFLGGPGTVDFELQRQ